MANNTDYELYGRGGYDIPGMRPGSPYTPEALELRRLLGLDPPDLRFDPADSAQIHDWQQSMGGDSEAQELMRALGTPAEIPQATEPSKGKIGQNIGMLIADALLTYASGQNPNVRPQHFFARAQELRREQAEDKTRRATQEALLKKDAADRSAMERLEELRGERRERIRTGERKEDIARESAAISAAQARADAAEQTRIREREEDIKMGLLEAARNEEVEVTEGMSRQDINNAIARSRRNRRTQEVGKGNAEKLEMADREAVSAGEELFNVYLFGDATMGVPPLSEQLKTKSPEQLEKEFARRLAPLHVPDETRMRLIYEFKKELSGATEVQEQGPMQDSRRSALRSIPGLPIPSEATIGQSLQDLQMLAPYAQPSPLGTGVPGVPGPNIGDLLKQFFSGGGPGGSGRSF